MLTNFSLCENIAASSPVQIARIVLFSVIFLLSLVGNTLIIIVVYKRPKLRKTVNYFIVNMAVSDFVFPLTAIPITLGETATSFWEWQGIIGTAGFILCKISSFLLAVSLTVSIESLVWIAIDRFVAVVWPLKVRLISSRFRAFAIASTWIVAVVLNSPELYFSDLIKLNGKMTCYADTSTLLFTVITYVRVALIYIAPMLILTSFYSVIAVTLRRQDKVLQCSTAQRQSNHKKQQAIKMSLCIVASFYLFFLPFVMMLIFWNTALSKSCSFINHFALFSSSAVCIPSTTNPIICFIFVQSFRRSLSELFNCSQRKRFKTRAVEKIGREEVILKSIKVI